MKKILLSSLLFLSGFSFGQVPSYVPTNGLVGWWGFNGNANDESGNGNNGTVNGATLTTDRFGNPNSAYDFDGVDDFINIGDVTTIENIGSMTWSAWVLCRSNPNIPSGLSSNRIISKELEADGNNRMTLIVNSNSNNQTFQFILNSSTNSNGVSSDPIIFDSLYFVTVVYSYENSLNSERIQIYLNANLILQTVNGVVPPSTPNNPHNLKFGKHDNNTTAWDGTLDDIGIWNRALTQCEISELYHAQQFTPPVLVMSDTLSACGASTTLDAGTDPSWASYLWNTTEDTQTISVSNSGLYTVEVTDTNGCIGYDTTLVSIIDPIIDQIDTNICIGDSLVLNAFNGNCDSEFSLSLDGIDDYVDYGDILNLTEFPISVNAWVKPQQLFPYDNNIIASNVTSNLYHSGFELFYNDSRVVIQYGLGTTFDPAGRRSYYIDFILPLNEWTHITGIINSPTDMKLFVNGQEYIGAYVGTASANIHSDNNSLWIGADELAFNAYINAELDNVDVWDIALDSVMIAQLMNCPGYMNEGLLFRADFEEGVGVNSTEYYGANGALTNGATWSTDTPPFGMYDDYTWSTGDTTASITVQPTTTTTYSVTVSDGISSCVDDVTITVNDPQVDAGVDVNVCNGDDITLSGSGADTYAWSGGITDGVAFGPTVSEYYYVTGTDTLGCEDNDSVFVTILQPTTSSITEANCDTYTAPDGTTYTTTGNYTAVISNAAGCDSTITIDLTITNSSSSSVTETVCDTYTAADGQTYTSTGNYTAVIPNAEGCDSTITIDLTVNALTTLDGGADITVCEGDSVVLSGSGAQSYAWNNSVTDGTYFTPTVGTTTYTVTGTDANGCSDTDDVAVTVSSTPVLTLTATSPDCQGEATGLAQADVTGGTSPYDFVWSNGALTSTNANIAAGSYSVTVTDNAGCEATGTVVVTDSSEPCFYIPGGLSPNGDNNNDTWGVAGLNNYPEAKVMVYNRWGQLLYDAGPDDAPWDGTYLGEELPTADYYYIIDLGNGDTFNGVVTLKR